MVPESPGKSYGGAREPRKELWPEDHRVICFPLTVLFLSGGGGPRTMAAAHDLEIEEDVNLNMETEMKEELALLANPFSNFSLKATFLSVSYLV